MPSAQVLGQLLLMQNVMCNLPNQESILSFVCRGLPDIPGVAEAHYSESCRKTPEPSVVRFPLLVGGACLGELSVRICNSEAFAPYAAYLENFCFMVAVILEERNKRREIQRHQLELEQRVEQRTKALTDEIAERKLIERDRNKLIEKLKAQNAELDRFTFTVSHDLKCPLITIQGFIGLVSEELSQAGLKSALDDLARVSDAADKMSNLLDGLLELSRIGRPVAPFGDVPLGELVREALDLVRGRINARGVLVEIAPNLPVVYCDGRRLLQVLQNLIENAVKYLGDEPHPQIEIGASRNEGETIFYVRDNGIGIEPRFHEKVFGLFDQLDPKAGGTGIGLSLVKRIIEVHGGRIWVESEGKGRGTTFLFTIPARESCPA